MSWDRGFLQLLPHTITVSTAATLSVGAAVTYSTSATSYRARVVNTNKFVHDSRGQGAAVAYEAWIASTSILSPQSKYTLPDGSTPPVVRISVMPDEEGHNHVHVQFGRA